MTGDTGDTKPSDDNADLIAVSEFGRLSAAAVGTYSIKASDGQATVVLTVSGADEPAVREFHETGKVVATAAFVDPADIGDAKVERLDRAAKPVAPTDADAPRVFSVEVVINAEERGRIVRVDWVIDPSVNNGGNTQDIWTSPNASPAGTIKVTSSGKVTCTGLGTISSASGTRSIAGKPIYVTWAPVAGNTSPVSYTITGGGYYVT